MLASRRRLLAAAPLVPVAVAANPAAAYTVDTTDLAVTCDRAAEPALRNAAAAFRARTGVRVRLFPTPPKLIFPQLQRQIQNDIVFTQPAILDRAEHAGLITPGHRGAAWRNPILQVTGPGGPENSIAVPDPTPGADFDGTEILRRIGTPNARITGVIDTETVVALLLDGTVRQGLLHQTEFIATPGVRAVARIPDTAWPPILYAAAVTRLARRPDPEAFVRFLDAPEACGILRNSGLESVA